MRLTIALCLCLSAPAGSLQRVWELNLRDSIKQTGVSVAGRPGVTALAFSPDGSQIATGVSGYKSAQGVAVTLLVIDVAHPAEEPRRFETGTGSADDSENYLHPPAIAWSPDGKMLLGGNALVRPSDGSACTVPGNAGFLSRDTVIAQTFQGPRAPHSLERFDLSCHSKGSWQLDGNWVLSSVSPDRGLVSATKGVLRGRVNASDLAVLDPINQRVIRTWPAEQAGGFSRFAGHGTVLCTGNVGPNSFTRKTPPPRCFDVDTGKQIAEDENVQGGAVMSAAEDAPRVIVSDHRLSPWAFILGENETVLRRRVVWDSEDGREVASWSPERQVYSSPGLVGLVKRPFIFAISPDGEYLAEGGNDVLRLYRIQP